ncbi:MAG: DoxX family protein [Alphaproteobacteria bacterium]|jgi:putative oxidoreductase|nr:DoxX family protein [Alphaproteobacteria bacterium]
MSEPAASHTHTGGPVTVRGLIKCFVGICGTTPHWLLAIIARVSIATVFWKSAQTKVDGFTIKDSTFFLFENEYNVPLLPPEFAAYMATVAEHVFPVLLIIGFASRFSALALLGMTMVIQLFVYPNAWPVHILWVMALAYIIGRGPGPIALDHLIAKRHS